ncbi:hypothetical protein [Rhodococcus marinonascens]|nr:hypothetical protein [Rhodococcus marinonascens]
MASQEAHLRVVPGCARGFESCGEGEFGDVFGWRAAVSVLVRGHT